MCGETAGCDAARDAVLRLLLEQRDPGTGVWTGELAPSALSTALASAALALAEGEAEGDGRDRGLARSGRAWLTRRANADGGFGDTPDSPSNLSTTLIAAAALRALEKGRGTAGSDTRRRAEAWAAARTGTLEAGRVVRALGDVYGADKTFAVPILAFLAMCGGDTAMWRQVPPLPFLLALLPQGLYRFFKLQVVSYALPALIAVGLCRHVKAAETVGLPAWGRLFAGPLLRRLERLQPAHGGFLDAIPLTAFVCVALRHAGYGGCAVVQKSLAFLRASARPDGSWAIDSNLRTWVTSLAARGIVAGGRAGREAVGVAGLDRIAAWLVKTQVKARHPFTGAEPGGWAWTDLPGGVPDADDTAGALVALRRLKEAGSTVAVEASARSGIGWLLGLQNADGGLPTFCRGWGRLPFDRSCPDISAHALAALAAWHGAGAQDGGAALDRAMERIRRYLGNVQNADGSWMPLWFGHQAAEGGRNPVVGTARVVDALRKVEALRKVDALRKMDAGNGGREIGGGGREAGEMLRRGEAWLLARQRADGGWGMGSDATVEETALAVIALAGGGGACAGAARRGRDWLAERGVEGMRRPAPIGLYFSLLWYHEKLYPLVWALEALGSGEEG
jgi:squalene-hopene/tetraprenyl-beta-curcumene cyclase